MPVQLGIVGAHAQQQAQGVGRRRQEGRQRLDVAATRQMAGLLCFDQPVAECGVKLASISPVTSPAAQEAGLTLHAEADEHTWDGILAAIGKASA